MWQYPTQIHKMPPVMPSNIASPTTSFRAKVAQAILKDAEMKAFGRGTRLEKALSLISMISLLAGYLLATQTQAATIGAVVFFGSFGVVLGTTLVGWLPSIRRLRCRMARCGLEAAEELKVPDLLAARWAIGEMTRHGTGA
jgi:hypothetical protein